VPEIGKVRAFISNGDQGVNFSRGVWHFPLISIEDDAQFVVIDRLYDPEIDKIEQCNVYSLNEFNITLETS
jgi:ureidoglycolate lyase